MGLVDYGSDSESEPEIQPSQATGPGPLKGGSNSDSQTDGAPQKSTSAVSGVTGLPAPKRSKRKVVLTVDLPTEDPAELPKELPAPRQSDSKASIASLLPAPKRRALNSTKPTPNAIASPSESRPLESQPSESRPSASRPSVASNFVPASVLARQAKYGASKPSKDITSDTAIALRVAESLEGGSKGTGKPKKDSTKDSTREGLKQKDSDQKPAQPPKENSKPQALPSLFSFSTTPSSRPAPGPQVPGTDYTPIIVDEEVTTTSGEADVLESDGNISEPQRASVNLNQLATSSGISTEVLDRFEARNKRSQRDKEEIKVVDFSVDEFYTENERLRAEGVLQESKRPVYAIGGGRHQLSSLLSSARANKEGLEDMFAQGKRNKAESGSKYGF